MKMKLYKIPLSFVELRSHEEHNFLFVMLFDNKKVSIVEDTIPTYVTLKDIYYICFTEGYILHMFHWKIYTTYVTLKDIYSICFTEGHM
jgi:hypothetical protein